MGLPPSGVAKRRCHRLTIIVPATNVHDAEVDLGSNRNIVWLISNLLFRLEVGERRMQFEILSAQIVIACTVG
jgi:hypothetical protein